MSSMSVVDNIQLVDVNKNTHPQAILVKDDQSSNNDLDLSLSDINSNEIMKFPSKYRESSDIVYAEISPNQLIDFEVGPVVQNNDLALNSNSDSALDKLKYFASIFIPIYSFFKNLFSNLNIFEMFSFNISFNPFVNAAKTVMDFGASIYQSGKNIFCNSIDAIADMGKSAWDYSIELGKNTIDYSVELGKSIFSTITSFFGGDSSTPVSNSNVEEHKSEKVSSNKDAVSQTEDKLSENKGISRPYWKSLDKISGPNQQVSAGKKFFNHFKSLRNTPRLDNNFLFEGEHSILQINGQHVSKYSPESMLNDFKTAIPNLESRQLISSYAHQGIFSQPYVELFAEHPNLVNFKPKDSQFSYVIREIEDGVFQFTATSQADLESVYETSDHRRYNAFGVQASMTLSKDQFPDDIQYSYYLR